MSVRRFVLWAGLALSLAIAAPALAVEPGEQLEDPVLEERARDLSKGLRCLVCRNESIDESNADLARDMRILVRERLVAGDSDGEVIDFLVDRYGEFVLLKPRTDGSNLILWVTGPVLFLVALLIAFAALRQRGGAGAAPAALTKEEEARLNELLKD